MNWQAGQRDIAEPASATVSAIAAPAGAHIHIDVAFRVMAWPWNERGPLSVVPQPCRTVARTENGEVQLGFALPAPGKVLTPPSHSATDGVRFTLSVSTLALSALEASRNGGPLELIMELVAHPFFAENAVYPTTHTYSFRVPKEQWTSALQSAGYCDFLITELRLPADGPEATAAGRRRLQSAVVARNDGNYGEAMRRSRMALDELKTGGFGGKAPSEVANFLQQRAGAMSSVERFSVLQIALQLFSSPAHHANAPDEHYIREQADLAIGLAAALLKLAPMLGIDPQKASDETP